MFLPLAPVLPRSVRAVPPSPAAAAAPQPVLLLVQAEVSEPQKVGRLVLLRQVPLSAAAEGAST